MMKDMALMLIADMAQYLMDKIDDLKALALSYEHLVERVIAVDDSIDRQRFVHESEQHGGK